MPDFMTHILFASESLQILPESRRAELEKHKKLLNLGAQGPDPFFYHGRAPYQKDKGYPQVAGKLHTRLTDEFLADLWEAVREPGPYSEAERFAYAWGFSGHHALDTQCHPYVYAQAGYAFNGAEKTQEMTANHVLLEAAIDTLLYRQKTGKDLKQVKLWELTPTRLPGFLDDFYGQILPKFGYSDYREGDLEQALSDMKKAQRFLYDPHGWKYGLNRLLSQLHGHSFYVGKPVYPSRNRQKELDFMNLDHAVWSHPMDEAEEHRESFPDLYEQALGRMRDYYERISAYLRGELNKVELFEGYSYDTKLRWDSEGNQKRVSGQGLMHGLL